MCPTGFGVLQSVFPENERSATGQGQDDVEWWTGNRARVFISCGQREGETDLASRIRDIVKEMGFCPYFAIEVHSPQALTEGIYQRLSTADYFLFVDSARESIDQSGIWRGSLFSNQELAIASYLEIPTLPFLQKAVSLEGILLYIQGNPIRFDGPFDLADRIRQAIQTSGWHPLNRRELEIERSPQEFDDTWIPQLDANGQSTLLPVRYFHLSLHNQHWRQLATNCIVHVGSIRNKQTGERLQPDTVELKFKHVTSPSVTIPPESRRQFDGFLVPINDPSTAIVGILNPGNIDSTSIVEQHRLRGPGNFELELVAYSREFRPARAMLHIHLGKRIDETRVDLQKSTPSP